MNQDLLAKVVNCPRLPSLPAVTLEVIDLCRQDDVAMKQIAQTISNDPALTSKVLRTVNSSYYGLSQPVATINHALVILGLNSVRTLALGFTLVSSYRNARGNEVDLTDLWRRCLFGAVAARSLAQQAGLPQDVQEEAFLGGLLQDLGVIALLQTLGDKYVALLEHVGDAHNQLSDLEQLNLDFDHAVVGEAMSKKWNLPVPLRAAIRHHEDPNKAPPDQRQLAQAVSLGGAAADVFVKADPSTAAKRFLNLSREWFGMNADAAGKLLDDIKVHTEELAGVFELNLGPDRDATAILAEANEMLLEFSLRNQQAATDLEQRNRELQQQANTDALTGVANRGHFNDEFKQAFSDAKRNGTPLGLILLDVDRFKDVNDQHGHLAGDKALIAIAAVLREHAPANALVARFGGEEFCLLLPGADRREAAGVAENIRRKLEATPVAIDGGRKIQVTASTGVACFDGQRFFARPEQLLRAADQAVYAAKSAGRNCVRIFTPRAAA